ncbi:MAG: hypothetical protein CL840_02040 [Crocinitomicaceae bacterium]|nr:hypothetical protein [Crocinitomicaceae bacterium]|tara:strand:- start:5848 stop:6429 length:582 start_codon:yes stop_codon:yes gene_type:complete
MKIVIIDDHESVGQGLEVALAKKQYKSIKAFSPVNFDFQKLLEYDLLLLDYDLGSFGHAAKFLNHIDQLKIRHLKIIIFSSFTEPYILTLCRHKLVKGYVNKLVNLDVLAQAMETVFEGGTWYQPEQREEIKQLLELPKSDVITEREREIIGLAKQKKSREEIAEELNLSIKTIDSHLQNIYQKLDINSMREL